MTILSKRIEDTERRAQALLADLIPLVYEKDVAQDPEFIALLEKALVQAEFKLEVARAETGRFENLRPKESISIDKPHETAHP